MSDPPVIYGPPAPPAHIPNGKPNPYAAKHKARLAELRELCATDSYAGRNAAAAAAEWQRLPVDLRLLLLVYCGHDGDPNELLRRDWRELPDTERISIAALIKNLQRHLRGIFALTA